MFFSISELLFKTVLFRWGNLAMFVFMLPVIVFNSVTISPRFLVFYSFTLLIFIIQPQAHNIDFLRNQFIVSEL